MKDVKVRALVDDLANYLQICYRSSGHMKTFDDDYRPSDAGKDCFVGQARDAY